MTHYRVEPVTFSEPCEHGPGDCGARLSEGGLLVHDRSGYAIWDVAENAPWSSGLVFDSKRVAERLAAELD